MIAMASTVHTPAPLIELSGITLTFPLYQGSSRSLKKNLLFHGSAGRIGRDSVQRITINALRDISFSINKGDRIALIGANGAGKTTLLRVLAGIYEPTLGTVAINGRVSPMFDIGLGIDPELSGYENIYVRGLVLGLSVKEIKQQLPQIAEYTELGDYLHMPMRVYSAGMTLRLTFATATCFQPEILLMDEWIVAGDASFIQRAQKRIDSFIRESSAFVLATHDLAICRRWCTKAIWMDAGTVKCFGDINETIDRYQHDTKQNN